jgi:hypothetical protein
LESFKKLVRSAFDKYGAPTDLDLKAVLTFIHVIDYDFGGPQRELAEGRLKGLLELADEAPAAFKAIERDCQNAMKERGRLDGESFRASLAADGLLIKTVAKGLVAEDVQKLTVEYQVLADRLERTATLADKVKNLDKKVTGIEDSIKSMLAIGNAKYVGLPALRTPTNDARDVGHAFEEIGYKVTTSLDTSRNDMLATIDTFIKGVSPGDTVVFYYTGHGLEVEGTNYIVPIDVGPEFEADAIAERAISLSEVIERFQKSNASAVVLIIDACRSNPFKVTSTRGLTFVNPHLASLYYLARLAGKSPWIILRVWTAVATQYSLMR